MSDETQQLCTNLRDEFWDQAADLIESLQSENAAQARRIEELLDLRDKAAARATDAWDFVAGTSLCEGCQQKRVERRIIATPRIQVEEERDALRATAEVVEILEEIVRGVAEASCILGAVGNEACPIETEDFL